MKRPEQEKIAKRKTKEAFIAKAREVYGDKYCYDDMDYVDTKHKVKIGCPDHGPFFMKPNAHQNGQGCPKCGVERRAKLNTMSYETFVIKAKEVHDDFYDYSRSNMIDKKKVEIGCPKHGWFWQNRTSHLQGCGCPKCGNEVNIVGREEFIRRANEIHNFRYDYSQVVYIRTDKKVIIGCPDHGPFDQTPNGHQAGYGCPKCWSDSERLSQEEFIDRCNEIHKGKYCYDKTIYTGYKDKVVITCPVSDHGDFDQLASNHIIGSGCPKCALADNRYSRQEFIDLANKIHNFNYDYSLVKYTNGGDALETMICPDHGEFEQRPHNHLGGQGCPKCGVLKRAKSHTKTQEEILEEFREAHGDLYDYSKMVYVGDKKKVIIGCKNHGDFNMTPHSHKAGRGCPKCPHTVSQAEIEWLDSLEVLEKYRQVTIKVAGKTIRTDAYDPVSKTVYEFNGDYWHGNPNIYDANEVNGVSNKTFGELYTRTINRDKLLVDNGYTVVSIWESDWKILKRNKKLVA